MTSKELYDYITSQIPPEQALMKLLESALITYEKLKFDENEQPVHPLFIMSMAAMDLGWQLAVESKEEEIEGLAVGTEKYMNRTFPKKVVDNE